MVKYISSDPWSSKRRKSQWEPEDWLLAVRCHYYNDDGDDHGVVDDEAMMITNDDEDNNYY